MGCDFYESDDGVHERRHVPIGIGEGSIIQGAIIDKDVSIGKNVTIINETGRQETSLDHPLCVIRDGIPIIIKNSILPDGWSLENEV